ncbi:unnamed protein product, partial [marine sediment metagenome]
MAERRSEKGRKGERRMKRGAENGNEKVIYMDTH